MQIKLGIKAKDIVTGFSGTVISRIEYLNGCVQYCIKPTVDKDGKMRDGEWFDDSQIVPIAGKGVNIEKELDGGPIPDTPSGNYRG